VRRGVTSSLAQTCTPRLFTLPTVHILLSCTFDGLQSYRAARFKPAENRVRERSGHQYHDRSGLPTLLSRLSCRAQVAWAVAQRSGEIVPFGESGFCWFVGASQLSRACSRFVDVRMDRLLIWYSLIKLVNGALRLVALSGTSATPGTVRQRPWLSSHDILEAYTMICCRRSYDRGRCSANTIFQHRWSGAKGWAHATVIKCRWVCLLLRSYRLRPP